MANAYSTAIGIELRKMKLKGKPKSERIALFKKAAAIAKRKVSGGGKRTPRKKAPVASAPGPRRSSKRPGRYVDMPLMVTGKDVASGEFRDPRQELPQAEHAVVGAGTVANLQNLAARVASSQQGIRPTFRPHVRLMLASGVM